MGREVVDMTVKSVIVAVLLLTLAVVTAEAGQDLRVELEIPVTRWVVGEPVPLSVKVTNSPRADLKLAHGFSLHNGLFRFHIDGPLRGACTFSPPGRLRVAAVVDFAAGSSKRQSMSVSSLGIVDPGTYAIWLEYDSTALAESWDELGAYRGSSRSAKFIVTIVEPQKEDLAALTAFESACHYLEFNSHHKLAQELVREYPRSVYAGWVLLGGQNASNDHRLPLGNLDRDLERVPQPARATIERLDEWRFENGLERISGLTDFLEHRPDFILSDEMKYEIACWRAYRREHDDARVVLQRLVGGEGTSWRVRQKSRQLLAYLGDAGE